MTLQTKALYIATASLAIIAIISVAKVSIERQERHECLTIQAQQENIRNAVNPQWTRDMCNAYNIIIK